MTAALHMLDRNAGFRQFLCIGITLVTQRIELTGKHGRGRQARQ